MNTTSGAQAATQMSQAAQSIPATSINPAEQQTPDSGSATATQQPASEAQVATQVPNPQSGAQPGQSGPSQPQQNNPNVPQQGKPGAQQSQGQDDNGSHPLVQKANILRATAQALAGGPRYTTSIDPNTGVLTRTPQPTSGKDIAMAIALEAITGAAKGLAITGPGATGKAAAAGFDAGVEQQQQIKQQQDQEASQNYARQAAITQTNFQTHSNALRLSQMEQEYHKQFVDTAAPVLKNINDVGAALENGVAESDLLTKYHVTKDMAIPDGIVQRGKNPDGSDHYENTYTVIDPNKKIALDDKTSKLLADLRVPGYFTLDAKGNAQPRDFSGSAQIKAGLVVNGLALAQGFQITEGQLNKQFASLGKDGDKDSAAFDANLKQSLATGDVTPTALKIIGQYSNVRPDLAVAQMEKNKVDPTIIGQYEKLVGPDAMEQFKQKGVNDASDAKATEAAKNVVISKENAEGIMNDSSGKYTPQQKADAQATLKASDRHEVGLAATKASVEETARLKAKDADSKGVISDMMKDPAVLGLKSDPNETPDASGVRKGFLAQLQAANPNLAAVIQAVGEGRQAQSKYGLAKQDGQALASLVNRAYPSYDYTKAESYEKMRNSFAAGPDKDQIERGNTAMIHAANFLQNSNKLGASIPGTASHTALAKDAATLVEEVNAAYTKGVLHESQRNQLEDGLSSPLPYQRAAAVKETIKLLGDKVGQKQETWRRGKASQAVSDFPIVSPEAEDAYKSVTGSAFHTVPNYNNGGGTSFNQNSGTNNSNQAARAPYTPPPGSYAGRDAKGNIVQWKTPNGIVDAKTGQPVQASQ